MESEVQVEVDAIFVHKSPLGFYDFQVTEQIAVLEVEIRIRREEGVLECKIKGRQSRKKEIKKPSAFDRPTDQLLQPQLQASTFFLLG